MKFVIIFALACLGVAEAIVGGEVTSIEKYPFATAMLLTMYGDGIYRQACGGTLLSANAVMSAGHCFKLYGEPDSWRMRLGSTQSNSSGTVYETLEIILHSNWSLERDALPHYDIAIVKPKTSIVFVTGYIQPATIATPDFVMSDNVPVTAIGWGRIDPSDEFTFNTTSIDLREVEVFTINHEVCQEHYSIAPNNYTLTEFMVCSGIVDVGGKDQCQGDSGSPLIYADGTVVGICSFGINCATPQYPQVNTRVSQLYDWIQTNL